MMHDIPILMLHSVNDYPEENPLGVLSVSSKGLESYLKCLKKWNYHMISMDDLLRGEYDTNSNFIVLTFDDGYKDNLTVAAPILSKYNARATIFANPGYTSNNSDTNSDWGFMTWDEIAKAEKTGIFDIQAHTMTHEFIFISDKVIDYYSPEKFKKYYWLAWMLFPESPKTWNSTANSYKDKIPIGYPIFEYSRRLSSPKFIPSKDYIDFLIEEHRLNRHREYEGNKGAFEDHCAFLSYARWEIEQCKFDIEKNLDKKVHTLCFPGGGYTEEVLKIAENAGYKCYMNASRLRIGNNFEHLKQIENGSFAGLNRTSFSIIHPGFLPDSFYDYYIAKLSLGAYQKKKSYALVKKGLSLFLHA